MRQRHQVERNNRPAKRDAKMSAPGDYARLALWCPLVRWRWKSLPLATETKSWAHRRKTQQGGSWASDGLGWGWHVCMSVFVYVCVWELLSLFNRHWKRKQKIYSNMTKIKGIVHSRRVNILPLFTHFHVILNLSFFCGTHKEDISWKIHLFTDNPTLQAVNCKTICESMTQRVELKNWINEHMIL